MKGTNQSYCFLYLWETLKEDRNMLSSCEFSILLEMDSKQMAHGFAEHLNVAPCLARKEQYHSGQ